MWLKLVTACSALILTLDTVSSNSGLSSTSFNNELRAGFTRLFHNGVEQPNLQSPFVLLNPSEFQTIDPQRHRAVQFNAHLTPPGYQPPRSRYELQHQSWIIPYYYVPTRYHPPRGNKRPNDVLVLVVKTTTNNCPSTNGTEPAEGEGGTEDEVSRRLRL